VSVQPYNALLTLNGLTDASDGLLLLQNEVLHATCTKTLGIKRPGFEDLNAVAAAALAGALLPAHPRAAAAPAAGGGGGRALGPVPLRPLGEITSHLTCHPR
jgi:tubulin delta